MLCQWRGTKHSFRMIAVRKRDCVSAISNVHQEVGLLDTAPLETSWGRVDLVRGPAPSAIRADKEALFVPWTCRDLASTRRGEVTDIPCVVLMSQPLSISRRPSDPSQDTSYWQSRVGKYTGKS